MKHLKKKRESIAWSEAWNFWSIFIFIKWTHHSDCGRDSTGNQSAAEILSRASMQQARRRDRGCLKGCSRSRGAACSRPIGAGDLSQDARGERRRGEERGETADGEGSRARLTGKQGYRPISVCPGQLGNDRLTERGTLRYDEAFFWLVIVLWFGMWPLW